MSEMRPVRHRCELDARVEAQGQKLRARVVDLSMTGAFVETQLDLQVGDPVIVHLSLPGGPPVRVETRIMRVGFALTDVRQGNLDHLTVRKPGFAVQFEHLPGDEVSRLEGYLELLDER